MPPTGVNTMTSILNPPSSVPATDISLREFVVDEDAAHFNAALWRTIDQNAFILAQRDALEAFNVAKALRLSEETAAVELERRNAAPVTAPTLSLSPLQSSRHKKIGATQHPQYSTPSDEAISRSLPRSSHTQVDVSQGNRSSPSSSALPLKSIQTSQQSSSYHPQDKKAPASIAKQNSGHQLSLSTSSFPPSVDSRHSRSTNNFTKVLLPPAGDNRAFSNRETGITDEPTVSTPSSSQFQASEATHPKRRRTERKPSVSSPSIDVVIAAPPLSVPQKSSTFSRSLRPGTIIPTTQDTVPASERSKTFTSTPASVPKKITAAKQRAPFHNPFNDIQICPQCGNRLTIPRIQLSTPLNSRSLCEALHTTCSTCMTRHCRGCTSSSSCTRSCSAGQNLTSCAVRNCCYNVRAVVIFEALNVFDHIFAIEAGFASTSTTAGGVDPDPYGSFHSGRKQREVYIKLVISKADKSMRKFEDAFVRTLKVICSWLQYSPEEGFDADDETSPASGNPSYLDASIAHLLLASYLPEVIHTFLSNNNVRDWIAHSDTYSTILETLRWISNFPTLSNVLNLPLPPIQRNCSLKQWATGQGFIKFLGYPSDAKKSLIMEVEPIGGLIRRLETHRSGLRAFSAKVQFEATLDKVNMLCDGISYLLLQQVVGGI